MVRTQYRLKRDLDWVTKRLLHPILMAQASTLEGANWREIFPAETFEMARPAALNDDDWARAFTIVSACRTANGASKPPRPRSLHDL
jgi:hypothetical protein